MAAWKIDSRLDRTKAGRDENAARLSSGLSGNVRATVPRCVTHPNGRDDSARTGAGPQRPTTISP